MKKEPLVLPLVIACAVLILICISLVMGVTRCTCSGASDTTPSSFPQQAPPEGVTPSVTVPGMPATQVLSSSPEILSWAGYEGGRRSFSLARGGNYVITATNTGHANFMVIIRDPDGNALMTVFDEIGPYSGNNTLRLDAGSYTLEVITDGSWTLAVAGT